MTKKLPKDTYLEISFMGKEDETKKALIRDFLISKRISPFSIVEGKTRDNFYLNVYVNTVARSDKLIHAFKDTAISRIKTKVTLLGPKEWLEKWHEDYHTQSLSRKFDVGPIWEKTLYKPKRGKRIIYLNPKSAFGSGAHETTKLIARLIEKLEGQFEDYLDLGTGTGILSVAAAMMGAKKIHGIDIDGPSVQEAKANLTLNGFKQAKFEAKDLLAFKHTKKYDLVGANLFSKLLVAQKKRIQKFVKPGGYLAVSGIMKRYEKEFVRDFKSTGFKQVDLLRGRRWIAVLYKAKA